MTRASRRDRPDADDEPDATRQARHRLPLTSGTPADAGHAGTTTTPAKTPSAEASREASRAESALRRLATPAESDRSQAERHGRREQTTTTAAPAPANAPANSNVAVPPQVIAAQEEALAAQLAGSAASTQALSFYRIPLFLLPIYQAASRPVRRALADPRGDQRDRDELRHRPVGLDRRRGRLDAVHARAPGLQYGVDALNAGYADPYNPVDAIFAAARYLRAAGAATDLHGAILAYNHSEEYVNSVLLRAKLISTLSRRA